MTPGRFGLNRYPGSKAKAARDLASLLPLSFSEYREPFCGSARMLAVIPTECKRWINDIDPIITGFLIRLRDDPSFVDEILSLKDRLVDATAIWNAFMDAKYGFQNGCQLDYFILTRYCYGQIVHEDRRGIASFSVANIRGGLSTLTEENVRRDHETLQGVTITNLDYSELLDAPGEDCATFLDPPYDVSTHQSNFYRFHLSQDDHVQLRNRLRACSHKWLMTIGLSQFIDDLYPSAEFDRHLHQYLMSSIFSQDQPSRLEFWMRNFVNH